MAEPSLVTRLAALANSAELPGDLNEALDFVLRKAPELTNADFAAVSLLGGDDVPERFVHSGMDLDTERMLSSPRSGRGLMAEIAAQERPLRLAEARDHPYFEERPRGEPPIGPLLAVPLRSGARSLGSVCVGRRSGRPPFSETDELAASVLALQAVAGVTSALERARLLRLSLFEERERIAHDLHSSTIQRLYAMGLAFDNAASKAQHPEVRETLRDGIERINAVIEQLRHYVAMLEAKAPPNPPDLARDLPHVVQEMVPDGVTAIVNVAAEALHELGPRAVEDLLSITRECLMNAIHRRGATKVALDVRGSFRETVVVVQDNGLSMDQEESSSGPGTASMRTRAALLGAELTVIGVPGMGTTVRVAVPLSDR